jgi:hypothetical protein
MLDKVEPAVSDEVAADLKESSETESRMRRALGLDATGSAIGRTRHPVTVEHRGTRQLRDAPVNRLALAEDALARERQAREKAERLVQEMKAALIAAETRYRHAELDLEEARTALAAERSSREAAAQQLGKARTKVSISAPAPVAERRRGRPRRASVSPASQDEAQPVEWWSPGWRTQFR